MYGNFMAVVFSVKQHLIRNRLSVNDINNKLITGLQIAFIVDNSFYKKNTYLLLDYRVFFYGAILGNNHYYFYVYIIF